MKSGFETLSQTLYFIQKARVASQVRKTHLAKTKRKCELTNAIMERLEGFEDWLDGMLAALVKAHPAYDWFSKVKGIGNINIGKVISDVDIQEASTISKLWRFAGFGVDENGRAERRKKGEKLHFNLVLKSMCWRLAKGLIRAKGSYYDLYKSEKADIMKRYKTLNYKIVPSEKLPKENGKHVEKDGYVALGHIDAMAQRKMIKIFLAHLWVKWRQAEGLPVSEPYAQKILGHEHYLDPDDFISH